MGRESEIHLPKYYAYMHIYIYIYMDLENESARMGLEFRAPGFGMSSQGILSTSYSLADCWVHVVSTRAFLTVLIQFEKLTSGACAGSGLGSGFRVQGFPFGVHVSDLVHWLVGPGNQLLREGRTLSLFSAT